jgi:ribosomal-protein-alanine N-acetyltransferase
MLELNFNPFPILLTERLILRRLTIKDAKEIFALRSDVEVNKYLDRPKANITEDAINFINKITNGINNNEWIYWAITLRNDGKFVGTICLWNISQENDSAEIGYELFPEFQGRGLMKEAVDKVTEFGFQKMGIQTIEAYSHPDNENSTKLLAKHGFTKQAKTDSNGKLIQFTKFAPHHST